MICKRFSSPDENDAERYYITIAIQVVGKYLTAATLEMVEIFRDEIGVTCERFAIIARKLHDK